MNTVGIVSCVGFFLLVLLVLALLQWLESRSSDWAALARRYPAPGRGHTQRLASRLWINGHRYTGVSTVFIGRAGIRLAMDSPLAVLFHRPVFIPWDDLTVVGGDSDHQVPGVGCVSVLPLRVGDCKTIMLTDDAADAANRVMQGRLHRATPRARRVR